MAHVRLTEQNKQPGICYVATDEGIELPVVDVTHPAFAVQLSAEKQVALVRHFLAEQRRFARLPRLVRGALFRFATRGSLMARGLRRAEGTFLDGMTTYLFKLGAKNLGPYARPNDRKIAASLPGLSVRLRLGDMARLLADALHPRLLAAPGEPLTLLNIAGGPSVDSLNALLLLKQERPSALQGRRCTILVLDSDARGPAFGARAAGALAEHGRALSGVELQLVHVPYDWREAAGLRLIVERIAREGGVCVGSSEGGLFEYGADEDIVSNLRALRQLGAHFRMVGSVTRDDETMRTLKLTSTAATRPRGLPLFSELAAAAGWRIVRSVSRPLSDQVVLAPDSTLFGTTST